MADGPGRVPTSRAPLDLQQSTWAVPVSSAHSTTPNISAPTPGNRRGCLRRSFHVVTAWLSQRGMNGAGNHTTLERLSRQPRSRAHHTQHMPPAMPATIPLGVPSQPQVVVWDPSASLHQVTDHGNDARRESQTRVFFVGTGRVRAHSVCELTQTGFMLAPAGSMVTMHPMRVDKILVNLAIL